MARRHSSFLLRCWDLGSNDEERIEIEHIQSGSKVLVRSVADATAWICAQGGDVPKGQEMPPERPDATRHGTGKGGTGG